MMEANIVMVNENIVIKDMSWAGIEVAEGYQQAYDTTGARKGVVKDNMFFPTVPLNGWRARELAEVFYGKREAGLMSKVGKSFLIHSVHLQNLPGLDGHNQAVVDSYHGEVAITVVMNDPGYGSHIIIKEL